MSAYICNPEHIAELAIFAATTRPGTGPNVSPLYLSRPGVPELDPYNTPSLATFYADILYQENIRSVRARYPDEHWASLPGPSVKPLHLVVTLADVWPDRTRPSPVELLKMADCLEYQSSETDDYRETLAYEVLDSIRRAAIRALPGYEEADWEYSAR